MYKSIGKTLIREGSLVLETDPELSRYYFSQLNKNLFAIFNKPRYPPHITIIRKGEYNFDEKYDQIKNGMEIEFKYLPTVEYHNNYFYIPIAEYQFGFLAGIRFRHELDWCFDKEKGFHITIANIK